MDYGVAPLGVQNLLSRVPVKPLDGGIPECDCVWVFG